MGWWFYLYLIPLIFSMMGAVWVLLCDKKITRGEILSMVLIFVPLLNVAIAIGAIVTFVNDKGVKKWLNTPFIDRERVVDNIVKKEE